jgi:1-acyl-sn-glycerol-3-phosphate acyltransferase
LTALENSPASRADAGVAAADAARRRDASAPAEPYVLPQWAIRIVRVTLRALFGWMFSLRLTGRENIPQSGGGLIVAANHQTYVDPFWVAAPFKRPLRFLAWDAVFGWPVAGRLMTWLGAWPLQVDKSDARAYRRSVQWIKSGGALVIFPEGGRGYSDGKLQPLKPGAIRLALETGAVILPVTIRGGHRVWPKDWKWPRLGPVEIIYHPPVRVAQLPGEDSRRCARREAERLAGIIGSAL